MAEHEPDDESPKERWHMAKVLVIRQGQGAIMQLAGGKHKAWLPQEQIKPLVGPSEQEILEALGKPVKIWLDAGGKLHTGLPVATMWNDEENSEEELGKSKEERLQELRTAYNPTQWIEGTVSAVKPFGIFVDIFDDIQVLVYIHSIPEELLERLPGGPRAGDRVPDVDIGDQVELRICGYRGKDRKGQDLFVCSMLPPSMDQPETAEKGRRKGDKSGKGDKGKGGKSDKGKGKGKRKDGKGGKEASGNSGYSVWVPDRHLESETTLARQEKFEVNALNAQLVEEQYGQGDRRAALARKGFSVVDYATSLQLSQVFKAKAEPKEAEGKAIAMPVWLTFEGRRKLIGKIQALASMTTSEKERLAIDLAMAEYNDVIQAGANVQKVDVNFDRVLIRLFADAGIQF